MGKPQYNISESLTKIVLWGTKNGVNFTLCYFINYSARNASTFSLPSNLNNYAGTTSIRVSEQFLYYRTLKNATNPNNIIPSTESVFFLLSNTNPKLIFSRNIPDSEGGAWYRTLLRVPTVGGPLQVCTETRDYNNLTVNVRMRDFQTILVNVSVPAQGMIVSNGIAVMCPPGCSYCGSSTSCLSCKTGYALMQANISAPFICEACGVRCTSCLASNFNNCTACYDGSFLSSNTCSSCSNLCLRCSGNSTTCTLCPPNQFLNSSASCVNCSGQYCLACTAAACTQCQKGFVLTGVVGSPCRRCASACSNCNPLDITQCTACDSGL